MVITDITNSLGLVTVPLKLYLRGKFFWKLPYIAEMLFSNSSVYLDISTI